ncbi:hypothetical protein MBAV_003740 [Candidatus Magnetobacterium bavaricum]|uniref:Uncharacterized protein n=1 Tax=Candidatus Magnetobacterium bavaricum TaxID=29290 RepID=A0A0F3GQ10_9BACT|nr:hypothetical protein MBAV_003740 [Candidatus Magnetobacterium bavaricum]
MIFHLQDLGSNCSRVCIFFIFHGKRKKEGGSAPSSDLPCKGASPLDPILQCFFKRIPVYL